MGNHNSTKRQSNNLAVLKEAENLYKSINGVKVCTGKFKEEMQPESRKRKMDQISSTVGQSGCGKVSIPKINQFTNTGILMEPTKEIAAVGESSKEYNPLPIRTKEEEHQRLEARWNEVKLRRENLLEGSTLVGTTTEAISSSFMLPSHVSSSMVLVIFNHLPGSVQTVREFCSWGRRIRGPSQVESETIEVFTFEGNSCWSSYWFSFEISNTLSLAVCCQVSYDGSYYLKAGFTPPKITLNSSLLSALDQHADFSADCFSTGKKLLKNAGVSCLISHGGHWSLVAHIEMTPGPQSVVHVDIWQDAPRLEPTIESIKGIRNGESVGGVTTLLDFLSRYSKPMENPSFYQTTTCVVQIANALGVSLKNGQFFIPKPKDGVSPPKEIISFTLEVFTAVNEGLAQGIFSYDIEGTDLTILFAFKCQGGKKDSFCTSIVPHYTQLDEEGLDKLMNPKPWNTFESRRYARAKEGETLIEARNVCLRAVMTSGKVSTLKIFVFTI